MTYALRPWLVLVLLLPMQAAAQSDDLAYCNKLFDLAVRYGAKAVMGDSKPTTQMLVAQDQCRNGNTADGIATLESTLRRGKVGLPARH